MLVKYPSSFLPSFVRSWRTHEILIVYLEISRTGSYIAIYLPTYLPTYLSYVYSLTYALPVLSPYTLKTKRINIIKSFVSSFALLCATFVFFSLRYFTPWIIRSDNELKIYRYISFLIDGYILPPPFFLPARLVDSDVKEYVIV